MVFFVRGNLIRETMHLRSDGTTEAYKNFQTTLRNEKKRKGKNNKYTVIWKLQKKKKWTADRGMT